MFSIYLLFRQQTTLFDFFIIKIKKTNGHIKTSHWIINKIPATMIRFDRWRILKGNKYYAKKRGLAKNDRKPLINH